MPLPFTALGNPGLAPALELLSFFAKFNKRIQINYKEKTVGVQFMRINCVMNTDLSGLLHTSVCVGLLSHKPGYTAEIIFINPDPRNQNQSVKVQVTEFLHDFIGMYTMKTELFYALQKGISQTITIKQASCF